MSKISSWFILINALGLMFYPLFWWMERPELTQMQVFLEWWDFIAMGMVLGFLSVKDLV